MTTLLPADGCRALVLEFHSHLNLHIGGSF